MSNKQTSKRAKRRAEVKRIFREKDHDLLWQCLELPAGKERWDFIRRHGTSGCGFSAITLARLGVKWPPRKGWRSRIVHDRSSQMGGDDRGLAEPRLSVLMGERVK